MCAHWRYSEIATEEATPEESIFWHASLADQSYANVVFPRVIRLVAMQLRMVSNCVNRDVIIIFGPEQIGKSTTINCMFGALYKFDQRTRHGRFGDVDDYFLTMIQPPVIPAAEVGDGNGCCTVFPQAYLDAIAAAQILLQYVPTVARSVRLVYLDSIDSLTNFAKAHHFGELLECIVDQTSLSSAYTTNFPILNTYYPKKSMLELCDWFEEKLKDFSQPILAT